MPKSGHQLVISKSKKPSKLLGLYQNNSGVNLETYIGHGNSLAVQWLGLSTFTAVDLGSIPGRGTKILRATQRSPKGKKKKRERFTLAKDETNQASIKVITTMN